MQITGLDLSRICVALFQVIPVTLGMQAPLARQGSRGFRGGVEVLASLGFVVLR